MLSLPPFRALSAALLVAALGLAALPGCGNKPAEKKDDKKEEVKKDDKKPDDPKPGDKKVVEPPVVPPTALGKVEPAAEQAIMSFLKEVGQGAAQADALSPAFLKAVGKPLELPSDVKAGVSRDAATRWLKRVGENCAFSPSHDQQQAGDVVFCRGSVTAPGKAGNYSLRLVKDGGAWKVDWFGLSTADTQGKITAGAADAAFQEFTARAFAEVVADGGAMGDDTRPAAIAHLLTADLRKAWAAPGGQDTAQGYDYSPGHLRIAALKYGGGTKEFAVAKTGDLAFSVTFTKPGITKTVAVKLVKGATPGEWLVTEVTEAKG